MRRPTDRNQSIVLRDDAASCWQIEKGEMGRRTKCKPRMIPQQDRRICGSICFCQLIVVFSSVSLIYLTVAIYIPSYRAFHSGFEEVPVMCQTVNTSVINNCSWASCGEWCLTKTSGFCPQIQVTTRRNGTELQFKSCTNFLSVSCPEADIAKLKKYNCNNGSECKTLYGVFNCSLGHCTNMSQVYQCHYKADGFVVDSDRDNTKLNGFFECKGAKCTKIKRAFSCDRYCDDIYSSLRNVFISVDDTLHMAHCASLDATTMANGKEEGKVIPPKTIWRANKSDILMMSCFKAVYYNGTNGTISGTDCINGTLYDASDVPRPLMNFTTFWSLQNKWREKLDPEQNFVPMQSHLTIYNNSHLYINLDGCVNTLKGECRQFLHTHGRDGRNQTAQSRFYCFYNKNNSFTVVARYDLRKTWEELVIAVSIPTVLFTVSFITLCVIMQSVKVGDDTKMRCQYCLVSNKSEQTLKYEVNDETRANHSET